MDPQELSAALTAVKGGDRAGFRAIYDDLKTPLYTVISRITRDADLAEDVMQEVFLRLYKSPPTQADNPRAYIFRTAQNLALDAVRARAVRPDPLEAAGETPSPERDLALGLDVADALAALDGTDCRIVTLHINAGLKFREAAQVTGLPLGTVLWRYRRAVGQLKTMLSGGTI